MHKQQQRVTAAKCDLWCLCTMQGLPWPGLVWHGVEALFWVCLSARHIEWSTDMAEPGVPAAEQQAV